jgi:hypothetical protein
MGAVPPPEEGVQTALVPVRSDLALGILAAAVAVAVAGLTLVVSRSFFLTDDYITYFRPGFQEIARILAHGQFPFLTDRLWNGGDLLQEYQYAVFNPVSLLLYAVIGRIGDPAAGAAVYSLAHIALLAGGTYALCRALGCLPRHAFLAGAAAPLSDWIFFWGATNWIPALVSLAWLVWAWALLIMAWRRRTYLPAAALAVTLTILSGWPFADFALLISTLVAARVLFVGGLAGRMKQAAWPILALVSGGLMAMPALLPLASYAAFAQRPQVEGGWATDLTGLLEFGMPFVQVRWGSFGSDTFDVVRQPIVYAAWFAPLALAGANWRSMAADRRVWIVLGAALGFAALSMISHIGLLRWMFRMAPYYQLALIVAAAMALTKADEEGVVWPFDRLALVIAAEVWLAFSQTRSMALIYLGVAYALGALAWLSTRFGGRRDSRWTALALATSVGVFGLTVWNLTRGGYPQYPQAWRYPSTIKSSVDSTMAGPERLFVAHRPPPGIDPGGDYWSSYGVGNTSLYRAGASIGGYSPMSIPQYDDVICWVRRANSCNDVVLNALTLVAPTGRNILDLTGVGEVDIERPADAAAFAASAGSGWTRSALPAGGVKFERPSREGQVTWASPGASGVTAEADLTRLVIDARNDASAPGTLVIARAWYPSWKATLNGAPVSAIPIDKTVIAIRLPPLSHGRLVLSFWPAGLTLGIVLAAIGAGLLAGAAIFPKDVEAVARSFEAVFGRRPKKIITA